jgi:hypothetical protein
MSEDHLLESIARGDSARVERGSVFADAAHARRTLASWRVGESGLVS